MSKRGETTQYLKEKGHKEQTIIYKKHIQSLTLKNTNPTNNQRGKQVFWNSKQFLIRFLEVQVTYVYGGTGDLCFIQHLEFCLVNNICHISFCSIP